MEDKIQGLTDKVTELSITMSKIADTITMSGKTTGPTPSKASKYEEASIEQPVISSQTPISSKPTK